MECVIFSLPVYLLSLAYNDHFYSQKIPLIDTRSCTADFRTNSFVGTEGLSPCALFSIRCVTDTRAISRVHRSRGNPDCRTYVSGRLVDPRHPDLRDGREYF